MKPDFQRRSEHKDDDARYSNNNTESDNRDGDGYDVVQGVVRRQGDGQSVVAGRVVANGQRRSSVRAAFNLINVDDVVTS